MALLEVFGCDLSFDCRNGTPIRAIGREFRESLWNPIDSPPIGPLRPVSDPADCAASEKAI
jgi:hypothetical protein